MGLKHIFEFTIFILLFFISPFIPEFIYREIGKIILLIFLPADKKRFNIGKLNIKNAFPDLEDNAVKKILIQSYLNLLHSLREISSAFIFGKRWFIKRIIFKNEEHLQSIAGKRVIFFSAHISNWEIMCYAHSILKFPINIVGRDIKNPHLDRFLKYVRNTFKVKTIEPVKGPFEMVRILKKRGNLGFLIDQAAPFSKGKMIDFFGKPAPTYDISVRLAKLTDAVLLPAFIKRDGGKFVIEYREPLTVSDERDSIHYLLSNITKIVEDEIRKRPGDWLWMHNRWRV